VTGSVQPMRPMPKDSVNYRPADDYRTCGNCIMFRPLGQLCTLVAGAIRSEDTCDQWYPR